MENSSHDFYISCIVCLYLKTRNTPHYTTDYESAVDHVEETKRIINDFNHGENHGYTTKSQILWDYLGLSRDYLIFFE